MPSNREVLTAPIIAVSPSANHLNLPAQNYSLLPLSSAIPSTSITTPSMTSIVQPGAEARPARFPAHSNRPTALLPMTATSPVTREWLVTVLTWDHYNFTEMQQELIHSVNTRWCRDGRFLRTASREELTRAFGGNVVESSCVFSLVQELPAEENAGTPPSEV